MVALALLAWVALGGPAAAASLSPRDVQVLGRALAFLQPPPASGELAVVYAAGNAASKQDAEAIAAEIGEGLHVGGAVLRPRLVASAALAAEGFAVAITAADANGPAIRAAIDAKRALCVTADLAAVEAGSCTMAIRSEPRVEIVVNHAVAVASDVEFVAAFRMMIREI
jgi:hypothetical protein